MSTPDRSEVVGESATARQFIISADSHVIEAADLMESRLPASLRSRAPRFPEMRIGERHQAHAGGRESSQRIGEMEIDGVDAEVIYPSYPMKLYSLDREDADLQEACFRAYNDWLAEYCSVAPERLLGIAMVSTYDIESAILEMERCKKLGMRGAMVWQCPPEDIPFSSGHYDPFWAAAQKMEMPISIHSLTGIGDSARRFPDRPVRSVDRVGLDRYRGSGQVDVTTVLFDIIFSGVLHRFPKLKLVMVENEIGWMPFMLQNWDKSVAKFAGNTTLEIDKPPSEYFMRQVYATFFNDAVGGQMLTWWGQDNCMWSNDFPHPNSTWPRSQEAIARTLGHLSAEGQAKVIRTTAAGLYKITVPEAA
jgi:predicted TIM-barrel fold metal-dependent hydrolase